MKEAKERKAELKEFSFDIVNMALKFCYNFDLPGNLSEEELKSLLHFSDMYQISNLKVKFSLFSDVNYFFDLRISLNIY